MVSIGKPGKAEDWMCFTIGFYEAQLGISENQIDLKSDFIPLVFCFLSSYCYLFCFFLMAEIFKGGKSNLNFL